MQQQYQDYLNILIQNKPTKFATIFQKHNYELFKQNPPFASDKGTS